MFCCVAFARSFRFPWSFFLLFPQKIFRGKRARDIMAVARNARAAYFRKCMEAAQNIQRVYRGRKGRMLHRKLLKASKALAVAKTEKSFTINVSVHTPPPQAAVSHSTLRCGVCFVGLRGVALGCGGSRGCFGVS